MFYQTYKNSIKRIIRSPLFLMSFAIAFALILWQIDQGIYGMDRESDYILYYNKYLQMIVNLLCKMMHYIVPCLAVITTMTAISGDYKNGFYEIEKAGGVKTPPYFFGRLSAIVTVNLIAVIMFSLLSVNLYFFTRGGTNNFAAFATQNPENGVVWDLSDYIVHSTTGTLRLVFTCQLPVILLCIGLTYLFGALLKSGLVAGIGGSSFVVAAYLAAQKYRWMFTTTFYKYFLPTKIGSYLYFMHYDTQFNSPAYIDPRGINGYMPDSLEDTLIWMGVLFGAAVLSLAAAFLCTHRRKI